MGDKKKNKDGGNSAASNSQEDLTKADLKKKKKKGKDGSSGFETAGDLCLCLFSPIGFVCEVFGIFSD